MCVVILLTGPLQRITGCWRCFDVLSNKLASPLLMGTNQVFHEINSELDGNRGCGVKDLEVGVALHCILFADGWVTPLRKTGAEGIITRGDSLPSTQHEEAMGSRLWDVG